VLLEWSPFAPKLAGLARFPVGVSAELAGGGGGEVAAGWWHTVSHIAAQRRSQLNVYYGNVLVTQVQHFSGLQDRWALKTTSRPAQNRLRVRRPRLPRGGSAALYMAAQTQAKLGFACFHISDHSGPAPPCFSGS
jgi:hypothetical protein